MDGTIGNREQLGNLILRGLLSELPLHLVLVLVLLLENPCKIEDEDENDDEEDEPVYFFASRTLPPLVWARMSGPPPLILPCSSFFFCSP